MVNQRVAGVPPPPVVATGEPARVKDTYAIKTHIFCSLQAFVRLEFMRSEKIIRNWHEIQQNMFTYN
ncbi:hypothetical protein A4S05_23440 [Nostoc sp. KVJ20]|nr:hypothetical protein A4S05_23440 [Nostoc sp. KVJ20]